MEVNVDIMVVVGCIKLHLRPLTILEYFGSKKIFGYNPRREVG
jgi:hypothetical protein